MRKFTSFVLVAAALLTLIPRVFADGTDVVVHLQSQSSITFTANQSSFQLTLPFFSQGATSDPVEITYTIMANNVGRLDDVILAHLGLEFDGIALEARMGTFTQRTGNAHLTAS